MSETSIVASEAAHFGALAGDWWDPDGASAMLHKLNPVRLGYIRDRIDQHWQSDEHGFRPLEGMSALDVGCGAGLLAEPLAALQQVYAFIGVSPALGLENAGRKFNENPVTFPKSWARSPGVLAVERAYSRISDGIIRRIAKDRETRTRMRLRTQSVFRLPAATLQIPESIRTDLAGHFAPDIEKLERLLGRRLPWKRSYHEST